METERGRLVTEDMKPARFTCKDARVRARPPVSQLLGKSLDPRVGVLCPL